MNKVIFEGGGDYPANEFIIGSGKNALLCRYQAEKQILNSQDQLTIEWAGTFRPVSYTHLRAHETDS